MIFVLLMAVVVGGFVTINLLVLTNKIERVDWHVWRGKSGLRLRLGETDLVDPYPEGRAVCADVSRLDTGDSPGLQESGREGRDRPAGALGRVRGTSLPG